MLPLQCGAITCLCRPNRGRAVSVCANTPSMSCAVRFTASPLPYTQMSVCLQSPMAPSNLSPFLIKKTLRNREESTVMS